MTGLSRSDIDDIIRLIDNSNFDELKLEFGDTRIEIRRNGAGAPNDGRPAPSAPASSPADRAPATRSARVGDRPPAHAAAGSVDVPAPQLGIFYHAPKPGEPPFVAVGDTVTPGSVIGIIEVMKLMNTVEAGVAGTVTQIVAPNGESVKAGDTLIRVRPAAD